MISSHLASFNKILFLAKIVKQTFRDTTDKFFSHTLLILLFLTENLFVTIFDREQTQILTTIGYTAARSKMLFL